MGYRFNRRIASRFVIIVIRALPLGLVAAITEEPRESGAFSFAPNAASAWARKALAVTGTDAPAMKTLCRSATAA
jgi:hypothetical protein